jgi:hypothetical protein
VHTLFTGQREREREREKERERQGEIGTLTALNFHFYACKGEHTLFTGQREREREREIKMEGGRDRVRKGERERCRIWLLYLFHCF